MIASDPDWEGRFEVLHLPRWRVNGDFLALLKAWDDALLLREPSHPVERKVALHLFSLGERPGRRGDYDPFAPKRDPFSVQDKVLKFR